MKSFVLGAVAAIGVALAFTPQQASAHWEHCHVTRWDPACCRYVSVCERYWVPDDPCGDGGCGRYGNGGYGGYGNGGYYGSYGSGRSRDPYYGSAYRGGYGGYSGPDYGRPYASRYPR